MSSVMELSLEDIIQKKKRDNFRNKGQPREKIKKNLPPGRTLPIADARNKIISKKRNQITDAREKLAQLAKHKDARLKLETLRQKRALQAQGRNHLQSRGRNLLQARGTNLLQSRGPKINRPPPRKEIVFGDPSRHVVSQPMAQSRLQGAQSNTRSLHTRSFLESRSIGRSLASDRTPRPRPKPILRTVENDLEVIDEPMDEDVVMSSKPMFNRKANLQLRIIAHNNDVRESRHGASYRLSSPEKSPPRPQSILKKRPMAALRTEKKPEKSAMEYRIIVSNLRNTVTGGDIEELFGDVGGMAESRLVRPGTAEVLYKSLEDAKKAVELYHNRQLDGQPMNCLLVTPRPSSGPATATRNGSKPALYSSSSNVEPDISTFHKVLFSNF